RTMDWEIPDSSSLSSDRALGAGGVTTIFGYLSAGKQIVDWLGRSTTNNIARTNQTLVGQCPTIISIIERLAVEPSSRLTSSGPLSTQWIRIFSIKSRLTMSTTSTPLS